MAFTLGAKVTLETLADARGVVTKTTARAVTTEVVALAKENISTRRAFFKGAVRTTRTQVTYAANMLLSVPRFRVSFRCFISKLFLLDATAAAVAVGGTNCTLTRLAVVAIKAFAFSGLAVTHSLHGAFYLSMRTIVCSSVVNPSSRLGAGADGAVVLGPRRVGVLGARVAGALVVVAAGAVAGAAVRAVGGDAEEEDGSDGGLHVASGMRLG